MKRAMSNLRLVMLLGVVAPCIGGCPQSPSVAVGLLAGHVVIPTTGTVFPIDPPVSQRHARFDLRIELADAWRIDPPYDTITIGDERVRITAELHTADGDVYRATRLGRATGGAGTHLTLTFPDNLPRSVTFDRVTINPSTTIVCRRIEWRDWTPK